MFQKAYQIARQWTLPVVLSRMAVNGQCSSSIGTFVVLNDEGWVLTAYHIVKHFNDLIASRKAVLEHDARVEEITKDASLDPKRRKKRLRELGQLKPDATRRASAWWASNGVTAAEFHAMPEVDLAVVRLEPRPLVQAHPVIKDPGKNFEPGTSLCKLGFPFYEINPTWDANTQRFEFPPGALPLPLCPIEGILTRFLHDPRPSPYPLMQLETSSPGLRGQSGGPIFDVRGWVWAIQSATAHYDLGFTPQVRGPGGRQHSEHQFLNVGRGVHAATIVGLLKQHGLKFASSTDLERE